MSIHTSKGTDRKVVILLNMNEKVFNILNTKNGELKYESLLHVAITR